MPNSSRFVFGPAIAPACSRALTTVASKGLVNLFSIAEAHVVGSERVHILSLMAISLPSRGDFAEPMLQKSHQHEYQQSTDTSTVPFSLRTSASRIRCTHAAELWSGVMTELSSRNRVWLAIHLSASRSSDIDGSMRWRLCASDSMVARRASGCARRNYAAGKHVTASG